MTTSQPPGERPPAAEIPACAGMTVGGGQLPDPAPYVLVFVLNYNGLEVLPACLAALRHTDYPQDRWQAVVLDNGSQDGSAERAERAHPWLEVRRLGRNLGFAAGNNAGLRSAPGPYAALLNSDTEVEPGWLTALVQAAEANPAAGACTAKLLFRHRRLPVQLQTDGFVPAGAGAGDTRLLGLQVQDATALVAGQRVAAHWGTGCFAPETGPYGPFRWTSTAGTLEVAAEPGEQTELYLRLAAPRPDDATVPFSVTVGDETVARSSAGATFSDYHVSLPGALTTAARPIIQNAGTLLLAHGAGRDRGTVLRHGQPAYEPDAGQYDQPEEVFGFCGAACLLRRSALDEVGYFDPSFFLYYEDLDLSWRLRLRGWTIRYVPLSVVWHYHAATSGEWSPLFTYYVDRNRPLMLTKNGPPRLAARELAGYAADAGLTAMRLLRAIGTRQAAGAAARRLWLQTRVLASWTRAVPRAWWQRRTIQAGRTVDDATLRRWMVQE